MSRSPHNAPSGTMAGSGARVATAGADAIGAPARPKAAATGRPGDTPIRPEPAATPRPAPDSPGSGKVICLGLGPGDPDLMSVRARRQLVAARLIAYFREPGRPDQARRIAEGLFPPEAEEWTMEYPVTTGITLDDPAYNAAPGPF